MNRNEILEFMNNHVYTSNEAAEYLNISMQRLHQLVRESQILPIKTSKSTTLFLKEDLDQRKILGISNQKNKIKNSNLLDIDVPYVRDAILYFTIQQYFNNSDKKTCRFIDEIQNEYHFDFRAGLKENIPLLSKWLNTNNHEFYDRYRSIKQSFQELTDDVIILSKSNANYLQLLKKTVDAPPFLFLKGNLQLLEEKSVCVVGSRNASQEGLEKTERITQSLIKRKIVVNAGLARGIDTITHSIALHNNGRTIAVIGTPINQYYPKENKELQREIEKKGLVISQFPPCNPVNRWNFPIRNATMSGISLATIIMEAGETSGALRQADYALKQGREVLIPSSAVNSPSIKWARKYLKRGAKEFSTLEEALKILGNIDMSAMSVD